MTPFEVSIIVEAKRPKNKGGLHEDDFDQLEERREQMIADGQEVF